MEASRVEQNDVTWGPGELDNLDRDALDGVSPLCELVDAFCRLSLRDEFFEPRVRLREEADGVGGSENTEAPGVHESVAVVGERLYEFGVVATMRAGKILSAPVGA